MKLFKKEEKKSCCCGGDCKPLTNMEDTGSSIKILGSGCAKCNALEEAVRSAIKELEMTIEVEHIRDFGQIASYGVMSTPALVYQGKVVSYGKVLNVAQVKEILTIKE